MWRAALALATGCTAAAAAVDWSAVEGVLEGAIAAKGFPGAVALVMPNASVGPAWTQPFGRLAYGNESRATDLDTMYDIASLTKVTATTTAVMVLYQAGLLHLDMQVRARFNIAVCAARPVSHITRIVSNALPCRRPAPCHRTMPYR